MDAVLTRWGIYGVMEVLGLILVIVAITGRSVGFLGVSIGGGISLGQRKALSGLATAVMVFGGLGMTHSLTTVTGGLAPLAGAFMAVVVALFPRFRSWPRRRQVSIIAAIAVVVTAASASAITMRNTRPPTMIAFVSDRTGNPDIFMMRPDGSGVRNLTNDGFNDAWPAWSPNGRRLALASDRRSPGHLSIYVTDPDKFGEWQQLTQSPGNDEWPTWSPKGDEIAFMRTVDHHSEIYKVPTTKQTGDFPPVSRLTNNPNGGSTQPSWSPKDPDRIVFSRFGGAQHSEIWTMDGNGRNQQVLLQDDSNDYGGPRYSPNGKKVLLVGAMGEERHVFMVDSNGGAPAPVTGTEGGHHDAMPNWSPDGKQIVFETSRGSKDNGYADIYVMPVTSALGKPTNLTFASGRYNAAPTWR